MSTTKSILEARMQVALDIAWEGVSRGQSPFGAAIFTSQGDLLAVTHNRVKAENDPSAHGEVLAIRTACRKLESKQLPDDAWLYSTGEPCPMCAATIVLAGLKHVVFGASVEVVIEAGYSELQRPCTEIFQYASRPITVRGGILGPECQKLLLENHS